MEFVATCSCKQWVGYAGSEKIADAVGSDHVRDAANGQLAEGGEHVITVRRAGFWD